MNWKCVKDESGLGVWYIVLIVVSGVIILGALSNFCFYYSLCD